jgi:hypothetical protein
MDNQLSKLKMLPVNKTVVFYSPIEGDDVLVRTGTIGEGSCFFHSLLHAYSKEYISMDKNDRIKFVKKLRASMAGKIDRDSWEDIGGGLISKIPFQEKVNKILQSVYTFINNDPTSRIRGKSTRKVIKQIIGEDASKIELYKLAFEFLTLDQLEQNILPDTYDDCSGQDIEECCDKIKLKVMELLDDSEELSQANPKKSEYIKKVIIDFLTIVLDESVNSAFNDYVVGLQNVSEEIDSYTIGLISERFDRDIYFMDSKTRMPYQNASNENIKRRKSLIIMWIGGVHYEIVGRLLPGNRIQREFSPDDTLIDKIHSLLCEPEKVSEVYPELNAYLPKEYRTHSSPVRSPSRSRSIDGNRIYESSDEEDSSSDSESGSNMYTY